MQKKYLLFFVALLLVYVGLLIARQQQLQHTIDNPEYQAYISQYRQHIDSQLQKFLQEKETSEQFRLSPAANSEGTSGNFEGPQVHLEAIKFHDQLFDSENAQLKHFDGLSAHFDPDHPCYGLPDVQIRIQDVRLQKPKQSVLGNFLSSKTSKQPHKLYKKRIPLDSLGKKWQYLVMQLWLTEFHVTVDISPDKDCIQTPGKTEKLQTTYPGYWYGSSQKHIPLGSLRKEYQDMRYGDLSFILKVVPDHSPIYYQSAMGQNTKADFAIGAIYCEQAKIGHEPQVQRISSNIQKGQPIYLRHQNTYQKLNQPNGISPQLDQAAAQLLQKKQLQEQFIWNKPYYFKLFFNNLGTWRSGIFDINQFHDQVTYKFLMPVFVVGSWDIIAPQNILPDWEPPQAYIRKFTLSSLLPFGNMGWSGKLISILFLVVILVMAMAVFFPNVFGLFGRWIGA